MGSITLRAKIIDSKIEQYLQNRWAYNAETGVLTWKNGVSAGKPVAKFVNRNGLERTQIKINGVSHKFTYARVCWLLHYGENAPDYIDHINVDPSDHRISNLRCASKGENGMNRSRIETRKHALPKNVYLLRGGPRLRVSVRVNYRTISGGVYDTVEEASIAAAQLRAKHHRSFAHG